MLLPPSSCLQETSEKYWPGTEKINHRNVRGVKLESLGLGGCSLLYYGIVTISQVSPAFRLSQSAARRSALWIDLEASSINLLASQVLTAKNRGQKEPNVLRGEKAASGSCSSRMQTRCILAPKCPLQGKNCSTLVLIQKGSKCLKRKAGAQWNFQNSDTEFWKPYIYLEMLNIFINLALNLGHLMV